MTHDVKYCFDDENVEDIARSMSDQQVRRLPVLNRDKRLVGVISIGDMAACGERAHIRERDPPAPPRCPRGMTGIDFEEIVLHQARHS